MAQQPWWREPTRAQWFTFLAAWMGWVLDAFDFAIFLVVMPEIEREFGVSRVALTGAVTLTLLLRLVGGVAAGSAADRWGRKLPLMISMIWLALCDGAIAFAPSFAWILVLRTLFGLGMGAEWVAGTTLAMENWPARSRGLISGILQGSWAIGMGLAGPVSAWIVPNLGWRALFLVAAAPALLVLPIRFFVPESPEWESRAAAEPPAPWSSMRAHLGKIIWGALAVAFGTGAYYALVSMYPIHLADHGVEIGRRGNLIAMFNAGMLVGAVGCGVLAARRGVGVAVAIYTLLVLPFLPFYVGWYDGALAFGAFGAGAFGGGIAGVTPIFLTSLFPPEVRGRGVAMVYNVGVLCASWVPPAMALLSRHISLSIIMPLAAAVLFISMVVILLGPKYVLRFIPGRFGPWQRRIPSVTSSGEPATPRV